MRSQSLNHVYCNPFCIQFPLYLSGWWFQPLWKTLVSWDDYSKYMETSNSCSKPPSRNPFKKTPIFHQFPPHLPSNPMDLHFFPSVRSSPHGFPRGKARCRGPSDARFVARQDEDPGADAGADAQQRQLQRGEATRQLAVLATGPRWRRPLTGWGDHRVGWEGDAM